MNFKELKHLFVKNLIVFYGQEEASALFYSAVDGVSGLNRSSVLLRQEQLVNEDEQARYLDIIGELKSGRPIQYILGTAWFYGLSFKVTEAVLIPRPETEELVQWIIEAGLEKCGNLLDIGTGSGCIAVSLKKYGKDVNVHAMDISAEALEVAKYNSIKNKVVINFIEANILNYQSVEKFDVIVSNPPYITEDEKKEMEENVLLYEPHTALFVSDNNPLIFYKAIADFALLNLKPRGFLFFEINGFLGKETVEMLKERGFEDIILRKDMQGKDRMIRCRV